MLDTKPELSDSPRTRVLIFASLTDMVTGAYRIVLIRPPMTAAIVLFSLRSLISLYAFFALVKFAFFFGLGYRQRREALDRAYAGKTSATKFSDAWTLLFVIVLAVLLALHGVDHVSFLTGLLIGMTLIQLYFHRFSSPLKDDQMPAPPQSPIKLMSYAIQAAPARPWKELAAITTLLIWSLYGIYSSAHWWPL